MKHCTSIEIDGLLCTSCRSYYLMGLVRRALSRNTGASPEALRVT